MKLFFKLFLLLSYAITGFFSFYLVVINFLEHLDAVSKPVLFFQLACSIVLAASGAILFARLKLAAITAIACLLGLLSLWLNNAEIYLSETGAQHTHDYAAILQQHYPKAYIVSFLLSIAAFFLPADKVKEA